MKFLGCVAQPIENDSGLHAGDTCNWIDLENPVHVPGKIENNSDIAALPRQRCASPTAQERRTELATNRNRGKNIIRIAGQNYTDRNLAIIGTVSCVQRAAPAVEANFAANLGSESLGQSRGIVFK